jgi:hypothetical protein
MKPAPDHIQIARARCAVKHILERIKLDEPVRYHLGGGTESFSLLVDAAEALFGEPKDKIVKFYSSPEAKWEAA